MKSDNIIINFNELSSEAFQDDNSDNNDVFKELGVNKDSYLHSKLKFVKKLNIKTKAELNQLKNKQLMEQAIDKVKDIIRNRVESTKEKLSTLINNEYPQFQFRNIDKLEEEDIKEVLNEIDLIEFIEKIEKLDDNANK